MHRIQVPIGLYSQKTLNASITVPRPLLLPMEMLGVCPNTKLEEIHWVYQLNSKC